MPRIQRWKDTATLQPLRARGDRRPSSSHRGGCAGRPVGVGAGLQRGLMSGAGAEGGSPCKDLPPPRAAASVQPPRSSPGRGAGSLSSPPGPPRDEEPPSSPAPTALGQPGRGCCVLVSLGPSHIPGPGASPGSRKTDQTGLSSGPCSAPSSLGNWKPEGRPLCKNC